MSTNTGRREGGGHQEELFPTGDGLDSATRAEPLVRPVKVITRGRAETAVRCPECRGWHRHTGLGAKTAPCGAHYTVQFRSRDKAVSV
ncbi:hypothetical protein ABH941_004938 [Streptacidiphilus sp. EB103A]